MQGQSSNNIFLRETDGIKGGDRSVSIVAGSRVTFGCDVVSSM